MLRKILLLALALVIGFLGYVALLPAEGRVVRTATIDAPADKVFPLINDFKKWENWSPWAKLDPNAKATFAGPAAGPGASMTWSGNDEVGEGTMTIAESKPNESVRIALDFQRPMPSKSETLFTLKQEGDKTVVTWDMHGERGFVARIFCTLFGADAMVGEAFERGLANLNVLASGKAPAA